MVLAVSIVLPLTMAEVDAAGGDATRSAVAAERSAYGEWRVEHLSGDGYRLTWRSPNTLPVTSARPEFTYAGQPLPAQQLSADQRTLTLLISATSEPKVDQLAVSLSGVRLDAPARRERLAPTSYTPPPPGEPLAADPGVKGPHAVVQED